MTNLLTQKTYFMTEEQMQNIANNIYWIVVDNSELQSWEIVTLIKAELMLLNNTKK